MRIGTGARECPGPLPSGAADPVHHLVQHPSCRPVLVPCAVAGEQGLGGRIQVVGATASVSRRGFADSTEGLPMAAYLTAEQRQLALRLKARACRYVRSGPRWAAHTRGGADRTAAPAAAGPAGPLGARTGAADAGRPEEITLGVHAGQFFTAIAARLGKAISTVSREVAANGGRAQYRAWRAHQRVQQQARRPKTPKLAHRPLAEWVSSWLAEWWSPVQISARLRIESTRWPRLRPREMFSLRRHQATWTQPAQGAQAGSPRAVRGGAR